jgi:hypothetical protein
MRPARLCTARLVAAGSIVAMACTGAPFMTTDGGPGGDGGTDATTADGGLPDMAVIFDATIDETGTPDVRGTSGNLLQNPSFEQACPFGWTTYSGATASPWPYAHDGVLSCLVCGAGTFGLAQQVNGPFEAGASFLFSAWFAEESDAGASPPIVYMYLDTPTETFSGGAPPAPGWVQIQQTAQLDGGAPWAKVIIEANGVVDAGTKCFLVDETSLVRQ